MSRSDRRNASLCPRSFCVFRFTHSFRSTTAKRFARAYSTDCGIQLPRVFFVVVAIVGSCVVQRPRQSDQLITVNSARRVRFHLFAIIIAIIRFSVPTVLSPPRNLVVSIVFSRFVHLLLVSLGVCCVAFWPLSDLLAGRHRVQRAVLLYGFTGFNVSCTLRSNRAMSDSVSILRPCVAIVSSVQGSLSVLLGQFHMHAAAARRVQSTGYA